MSAYELNGHIFKIWKIYSLNKSTAKQVLFHLLQYCDYYLSSPDHGHKQGFVFTKF